MIIALPHSFTAATAPGVTSYADPAYGRELRLVITPDGGPVAIALHDGASATGASAADAYQLAFTAGSQYTAATFDLDLRAATAPHLAGATAVTVDGAPAAAVGSEALLAACARARTPPRPGW